jgi:phosphate-selective porin OprO/OprP
MKFIRQISLAAATGYLLCSTSAFAAADSKALEERIKGLEAKISKLEKIIDQQEKKIEATATEVSAAPKKKVGGKDDEIEITMDPVPKFKSKDGNFTFQPSARIQADAAVFHDDKSDQPDGTTIRRSRVGFKGTVNKDWNYKTEVDFADNATKITDVYVDYTGVKNVSIKAGQFKEPVDMEEMTSDADITFIERASPNVFAPDRNIGLGATYIGDNWTAFLGAFGDNAGTASSDDEARAVTGRATFAPINEKGKVVHVGASGSYRAPDSATNSVKYEQRPETRIASAKPVGTGTISNVDNVFLSGLEAAGELGSANFRSEYISSDVSRSGANPDVDFSGWYAEASYLLTGEEKAYSVKDGAFKRPSPARPFSLANGGPGAWEVAARYSSLDLTDGPITGGEMKDTTLGVSWYPNNAVRFMADYIFVNTDNQATVPNDDPQVFTLRAQLDF